MLLQVLQLVPRRGGQRGQVLHDGARDDGQGQRWRRGEAAARRLLLLGAMLRALPPRRLQEEQVCSILCISTYYLS